MEFADMPPEMQFKIFACLNQRELEAYAAPVCPEWKAIVEKPIFRTNVFVDGQEETLDEIVEEINYCYLVKNLTINRMENWGWLNYSTKLDVLRVINFNSCLISASTLSHFVQLSPLVQRVKVVNCPAVNCDIISEIVRWKYLRSIFLQLFDNCDGNECLNIITEKCERLQKIKISQEFRDINDKSFLNLIRRRGSNLTSLNFNCSRLTTKSFSVISQCSQLTELTIHSACKMMDIELLSLQNLKCLRLLSVTDANRLTAKSFQRFFREARFPQLCTLLLGNCTKFSNKSAKPIGISCPALQTLFLGETKNVSDNGIRAIVSRCKNLRRIYLSGLNQIEGLWIDGISSKLPNLEALHFHNCYSIDFEILELSLQRNPNLQITDTRRILSRDYKFF